MEKIVQEFYIYEFKELSEAAQAEAIEWEQNHFEFDSTEMDATLDAFKEIFPITDVRYEYDEWQSYGRCSVSDDVPEEVADLKGIRLMSYLYNNFFHKISKGKYYSKTLSYSPFKYVHRHSKIQLEMDNCPLTGVCYDYAILQPVIDAMNGKYVNSSETFEDIMELCIAEWAEEGHAEIESRMDEDYIRTELQERGARFYEDGRLYSY